MELIDSAYIWLYAGNFTGWWCYDKNYNKKINKMYVDYCKRMNIHNNITQNDQNNKPKQKKMKKVDMSKSNICFDLVNFSSSDTESETDEEYIDYNLNINNVTFKIDFDQMKQINVADPTKCRKIERIKIPTTIKTDDDLIDFLRDNDVKGISGDKF